MTYHRVLRVAAVQIVVGDVVLTYRTSSTFERVRGFSGSGVPDREVVVECHRDYGDGSIHIATDNAGAYLEPFQHVELDCLLTFGKNTGETK